MIEVRKEIVEAGENIKSSVVIGYLDNTTGSVANFSNVISALAKTETLHYKLRGSNTYVRYVFKEKTVTNVIDFAIKAKGLIADNIGNANKYIDHLNKALRVSNRKAGLKADVNVINNVSIEDFADASDVSIDIDNNIVIIK